MQGSEGGSGKPKRREDPEARGSAKRNPGGSTLTQKRVAAPSRPPWINLSLGEAQEEEGERTQKPGTCIAPTLVDYVPLNPQLSKKARLKSHRGMHDVAAQATARLFRMIESCWCLSSED